MHHFQALQVGQGFADLQVEEDQGDVGQSVLVVCQVVTQLRFKETVLRVIKWSYWKTNLALCHFGGTAAISLIEVIRQLL